jgi:hypothetical protein
MRTATTQVVPAAACRTPSASAACSAAGVSAIGDSATQPWARAIAHQVDRRIVDALADPAILGADGRARARHAPGAARR